MNLHCATSAHFLIGRNRLAFQHSFTDLGQMYSPGWTRTMRSMFLLSLSYSGKTKALAQESLMRLIGLDPSNPATATTK